MANAHHVLNTFVADPLFSSFDSQFSTHTVSLLPIGTTMVTTNNVEVSDPALSHAHDIIFRWDLGSASCQAFIWTEDLTEARAYLAAIDTLRDFTENPTSESDSDSAVIMNHAQDTLQIAMLRLEEEFRNLLETHGMCLNPDFLIHSDATSSQPPASGTLLEQQKIVDLVPPDVVSHLRDIATRMVSCGYQTECAEVFAASRRVVLEESLQRLGLENHMVEEVQRMPLEVLECEIGKWIRLAKVVIGILFHREKELCKQVFFCKDAQMVDSVFADVSLPLMMQLLSFPEAVAIIPRTPEKMFKLMDMYEALKSLSFSMDSLFVADNCASLRADVAAIQNHLEEAVRGTFVELEHAVQRNPCKIPSPGGAVHLLTKDVMNYVKFFFDYAGTLNQVLKGRIKMTKQAVACDPGAEESLVGISARAIMDSLVVKLNAKSKLYKDPALASLFLMNNLHYMLQKLKEQEVWKLVGGDWMKRHSSMLLQHHNDYRRSAWAKVVACLRDEGINVNGSGSSGGTLRNVLRERLKSFAMAFEEIVKTQSSWIVSDSQLCTELQISITEMILPAYRSFLGRFQNYLDSRYPEKYIKYTAEDVEGELSKLFEGKTGSMNRRKSGTTPEGISS